MPHSLSNQNGKEPAVHEELPAASGLPVDNPAVEFRELLHGTWAGNVSLSVSKTENLQARFGEMVTAWANSFDIKA